MEARQPSLWENQEFEQGLHCLNTLDLQEAERRLRQATSGPLFSAAVLEALLGACTFWKARIPMLDRPASREQGHVLATLFEEYRRYPFNRHMAAFQRSLLCALSGKLVGEAVISFALVEAVFDELLAEKAYDAAERLITRYAGEHPQEYVVQYHAGQLCWSAGRLAEARQCYARALLQSPDAGNIARIAFGDLRDLVDLHGPAMAAIYAMVSDLLPLVGIAQDLRPVGEAHRHALQCHEILRRLKELRSGPDRKAELDARKQLYRLDEALAKVYLDRLRRQG